MVSGPAPRRRGFGGDLKGVQEDDSSDLLTVLWFTSQCSPRNPAPKEAGSSEEDRGTPPSQERNC
ncbi:hypothetical protein PCASD_16420 [Puccinia coronata f. sp. avenae]|uniref:Uncharacterized protein n=1 Tax=Puccinia coronata f. sp. avenae TaxID=200324 RepID=A0A2N5TCQ9_9BASI|nr:hypothetical protein PCASD_16420 [Puccinia coronata f. sp. avenae]